MIGEPGARAGDDPEELAWDEADEAMHWLLDAFLADPGKPDDRPPVASPHPSVSGLPAQAYAPTGRELSAGERLGRFRIQEEVGRGGFGVVYRATDTQLGRSVALKVPRPDLVQTVALWHRFAREARLAATLDHEAIVPVLDSGVVDGVFVLVGAYQEGEPLSRWLAARHPAGAPPRLAAEMMLRLASGVRHAHERGVLHRDLKPANVLMVPSPGLPGGWAPRITDFGLGTLSEDGEAASVTGLWQGSPPYMAPEQVLPEHGRVDARTDVYALGAVFYEMLTGRPVYPGSSLIGLSVRLGRGEPPVRPRRLRPDLPADLEAVCLKCLERDPVRRYPSAEALLADLGRYLDGRPTLARPIPLWARLGRWARRRPSHAALIALTLAATTVPAGLIVSYDRQLRAKNGHLIRSNDRLRDAVAQRDSANTVLRSTLDRLLVSERRTQRTAFAADLRLAGHELESGRVELAQSILRRYEPAEGRHDLRDFTWHYLMRQATRDYSIHPLGDLRWWRGATPLAPAFEGLDRRSREELTNALHGVVIDRDGIRLPFGPRVFLLGERYRGFTAFDEQGALDSHLWFMTGSRQVRVELPACWQALGPGGRVLALLGPWMTNPEECPPLIRNPGFMLPGELPLRGPDEPASVKVVTVGPAPEAVSFSGDGHTLACLARTAPQERQIARPLIYDLGSEWRASYPQHATRIEVPDPRGSKRSIPSRLVLSRDGRLAALSGDTTRLRVFESRTGRTLWSHGPYTIGADVLVTCMAFADDGGVLVTGDGAGQVRAWDAKDGRLMSRLPVNLGYVTNLGFHPDDRTVAVISPPEDLIRLWKLAPGHDPPTRLEHGDEVWGLAFTDSGSVLVSVGDDHRGRAWDLDTGAVVGSYQGSTLQSALAADPSGIRLAVGDFDGAVTLRQGGLSGAASASNFDLRGTRLRAVAFSPVEPRLIAAGGSGPRVLLATAGVDGKTLRGRLIETPHRDVYALAFAPDGRTLAMGSHDRTISLWDVPGLVCRATLKSQAAVTCLAYSPDGRTLVSGDVAGGVQFWGMPQGALRASLARASETDGVWALAYSPDGETLATAGGDALVRLWDASLGVQRLALSGHRAKVHALAFSPDGRTLASGDFAGLIRVWRAGP